MRTEIEEIMSFLKSLKGIKEVKLLTELEKKELMEIEEGAERSALMGLMPGINQGVREALLRTFTVAAITDNEFEWPKKGILKFIYKGEVIGEEVRDEDELRNLKDKGNRVIADFIVLYSHKMAELGIKNLRDATLVIAPLELPWVRRVPHAKHVVVGSPSTPSDLYIKRIMKWKNNGGSILIGFELDQSKAG